MLYKKRTYDRIAYTVFLHNAIMTYSNVHYGKGLDASISFFICLGITGVFSCIYEVAYETLTGEPMNILVTFLDLLSKKRKAKLVKVPVGAASPVQVLALPAPDILEVDIQEPVLDAIVIEDTKEGIKEESHAEPEIITEVEYVEVQEEIPNQESDSLSPSVNPVILMKVMDKEERRIEQLYTFCLGIYVNDEQDVFLNDILDNKEKAALHHNISEFVTKDHPDFVPVILDKKDELTLYDFYHLFHAVGYHAGRKNPRPMICVLIKESIPEYTKDTQISTINAKMTSLDESYTIPVYDRKKPLPICEEFGNTIGYLPVNHRITG